MLIYSELIYVYVKDIAIQKLYTAASAMPSGYSRYIICDKLYPLYDATIETTDINIQILIIKPQNVYCIICSDAI